jgi:hypothetical protein
VAKINNPVYWSLTQTRVPLDFMNQSPVDVHDVVDGLWIWRMPHPDWNGQSDWEPTVTSVAVAAGGHRIVLDPLAPPPSARAVWDRIEAFAPDTAIVLKPDHVRDVDLFVRWYGARALGPALYWRDDIPKTELEPIRPGDALPGGLRAFDDGRTMMETPVYLPEQRTLVFADALTAPGGELRVWNSAQHERRALPALRELLELEFERVIVSHGEPVHTREDFIAALARDPYGEPEAD